ncbi:hypothetical protein [Microbacterium sp. CFBP9034]|uniref:hypothetical protein n=1 Tax=Microbacterium sp. CFBP9034 TaxID=3096540 RepID=UPI002A6A7D06|nr:hypothetical protein [Microbacterium sp. CFBP9034]MDY0910473.1 hypothetical protein [Microbacterium sp. CFBP9034]
MTWILIVVAAPVVVGVAIGVIWRMTRGRRTSLSPGLAALCTGLAGVIAIVGDLWPRLWGFPGWHPPIPVLIWLLDHRYTLPLALGIVALVLLAIPVRARGAGGSADLAPRSIASFARGWWFAAPAGVLALIAVITIAAGIASQPDPETGRYDTVMVDAGVGAIGTTVYGWFYSVPALIALGVLILVACVDLFVIARPPLAEDRELDVRTRVTRSRNVLTATTAAMLLHVAPVFASLSATASVRGTFTTSEGPMFLWSPIAGFQTVFTVAAYATAILGIALWTTVALSAIPARRQSLVPAAA